MKNMKKGIVGMKYILLAVLLLFIVGISGSGGISNADLERVAKKVADGTGAENLSPADNRMVKRLYGLNVNDYEGVALYVSDSNMEVEEILVVKLKDVSQSESVETAIEGRLRRQLESFEGYGPEQCRLLNDHVLDIRGNYILFAVDKKAKTADRVFRENL